MANWNDEKNISLTFDVKADEQMRDFVDRMRKEHVEREEAFRQRIKQLFDEEIDVGGKNKGAAYQQVLQVFFLGYQHGWNDLKSLYDRTAGC